MGPVINVQMGYAYPIQVYVTDGMTARTELMRLVVVRTNFIAAPLYSVSLCYSVLFCSINLLTMFVFKSNIVECNFPHLMKLLTFTCFGFICIYCSIGEILFTSYNIRSYKIVVLYEAASMYAVIKVNSVL